MNGHSVPVFYAEMSYLRFTVQKEKEEFYYAR